MQRINDKVILWLNLIFSLLLFSSALAVLVISVVDKKDSLITGVYSDGGFVSSCQQYLMTKYGVDYYPMKLKVIAVALLALCAMSLVMGVLLVIKTRGRLLGKSQQQHKQTQNKTNKNQQSLVQTNNHQKKNNQSLLEPQTNRSTLRPLLNKNLSDSPSIDKSQSSSQLLFPYTPIYLVILFSTLVILIIPLGFHLSFFVQWRSCGAFDISQVKVIVFFVIEGVSLVLGLVVACLDLSCRYRFMQELKEKQIRSSKVQIKQKHKKNSQAMNVQTKKQNQQKTDIIQNNPIKKPQQIKSKQIKLVKGTPVGLNPKGQSLKNSQNTSKQMKPVLIQENKSNEPRKQQNLTNVKNQQQSFKSVQKKQQSQKKQVLIQENKLNAQKKGQIDKKITKQKSSLKGQKLESIKQMESKYETVNSNNENVNLTVQNQQPDKKAVKNEIGSCKDDKITATNDEIAKKVKSNQIDPKTDNKVAATNSKITDVKRNQIDPNTDNKIIATNSKIANRINTVQKGIEIVHKDKNDPIPRQESEKKILQKDGHVLVNGVNQKQIKDKIAQKQENNKESPQVYNVSLVQNSIIRQAFDFRDANENQGKIKQSKNRQLMKQIEMIDLNGKSNTTSTKGEKILPKQNNKQPLSISLSLKTQKLQPVETGDFRKDEPLVVDMRKKSKLAFCSGVYSIQQSSTFSSFVTNVVTSRVTYRNNSGQKYLERDDMGGRAFQGYDESERYMTGRLRQDEELESEMDGIHHVRVQQQMQRQRFSPSARKTHFRQEYPRKGRRVQKVLSYEQNQPNYQSIVPQKEEVYSRFSSNYNNNQMGHSEEESSRSGSSFYHNSIKREINESGNRVTDSISLRVNNKNDRSFMTNTNSLFEEKTTRKGSEKNQSLYGEETNILKKIKNYKYVYSQKSRKMNKKMSQKIHQLNSQQSQLDQKVINQAIRYINENNYCSVLNPVMQENKRLRIRQEFDKIGQDRNPYTLSKSINEQINSIEKQKEQYLLQSLNFQYDMRKKGSRQKREKTKEQLISQRQKQIQMTTMLQNTKITR